MEELSSRRAFGGSVGYFAHESQETGCTMRFSVFVPAAADERNKVPVLWWLSGLTCTEDNFTTKAGAYRAAAEHGLVIIAPDTSPRGPDLPDDDAYDLGQGAGFYVDATAAPWNANYRMYSYVCRELQQLVVERFPCNPAAQGISGHSMGGHGALVLGLRNPGIYRSISAFAPIVAPSRVPWGRKAFSAYLGPDEHAWSDYDATELLRAGGDRHSAAPILIDQGLADDFLEEQLQPELFVAAAREVEQAVELGMHEGYDHSYFFVASFIDRHIAHHARLLHAD